MDLNLNNKNFLVTGSTRGIGLSIAKELLIERSSVIITGRNTSTYDEIKTELSDNHCFLSADLCTDDGINKVIDHVKSIGGLDGIVFNLGSGASVPPGQETHEEWKRVFDINFFSATTLMEKIGPFLNENASVVFISSIVAHAALGAPLTYSAAKAAINSYATGLSKVLAGRNIRVNTVSPGNIYFPGGTWDRKLKENAEKVQSMLDKEVALKRLGRPEEISSVVTFLLSSKSSFMTGSKIVVDGGQLK